jgi:N-acetylglutamate synthase-like GNAT family acetyltransferase
MIKIYNLADKKEYFEQVFEYIYEEFFPNSKKEYIKTWLISSTKNAGIPQMLIALEKEKLVGCVGLWLSDLQSRQDLSPWLSVLYVDKEYRNQGIGKQLINQTLAEAKKENVEEIYLFTELKGYYEKIGWQLVEKTIDEYGNKIQIFKYSL